MPKKENPSAQVIKSRRDFVRQLGGIVLVSGSVGFSMTACSSDEGYDLIIVGAGSAGMPCAIEAAQRGARVLIIEKDVQVGGTLHWTAGHLSGAGTRLQQSKGIDDHPDLHYENIMKINGNTGDEGLIRLATQEAPKTLDWLESLGFEFDENCPALVYGHVPYDVPRTVWGKNRGLSILEVLQKPFERQVKMGRIKVKLSHQLMALRLEEGRIGSVIAEGADGLKEFQAESVVLCSGGYAANADLFKELHPDQSRLISTAHPHAQGEGLLAAKALGAQVAYTEHHLGSLGGIEEDPGSGRANFWKAWARVSTVVQEGKVIGTSVRYDLPREIYVNENGERFMAEDIQSPDARERAVEHQPNQRFWIIFDEKALNAVSPIVIQWNRERFLEECEKEQCAWKAENIEGLAEKTGLPEAKLRASINEFNQAVERGEDRFGRQFFEGKLDDAPFYAILTYSFSLISFGGLKVNSVLNVLNEDGLPFPNLYAAGEILGAGATSGNAFCGGMLLTPALSLGRYLGKMIPIKKSK